MDDQVTRVRGRSGYLLTQDLVLTSGGQVPKEGAEIDVQRVGEVEPRWGWVRWRPPDGGAALIQLKNPLSGVTQPLLERASISSDAAWCVPFVDSNARLRFVDGRLVQGRLEPFGRLPEAAVGAPIFVNGALAGVVASVHEGVGAPQWKTKWWDDPKFEAAVLGVAQRSTRAPVPARKTRCERFELVLARAGDGFVADLLDDDGQPLRSGRIFDPTEAPLPAPGPGTIEGLAEAARVGAETLVSDLRALDRREALGAYLARQVFGATERIQASVFERAGWGPNASCLSGGARLSIRCEASADALVGLPWRTLTWRHHLLEQVPGWQISIALGPQKETGRLTRPSEVLLVGLPPPPGGRAPEGQAHANEVRDALVAIDPGFKDRVHIATTRRDFIDQARAMHPSVIYVFGPGQTGSPQAPGLMFHPDFMPMDEVVQAVAAARPELCVLNLCEATDDGRFSFARRVAGVCPIVVCHPPRIAADRAQSFGLAWFERVFRHAEDPVGAAAACSVDDRGGRDTTTPVVIDERKRWTSRFGPQTYSNYLDVLHHLDRTEARDRVRNAVRDGLKNYEEKPLRCLAFVYLGRPGNLVERFAPGLFRDVDDDIGDDYPCFRLAVGDLPRSPSPEYFEEEIRARIRDAFRAVEAAPIREHAEQEDHRNAPFVVWIDWGTRPRADYIDWKNSAIAEWHAAARQVIELETTDIPPSAVVVTTFGRELPDDGRDYGTNLRRKLHDRRLDAGSFQVDVLRELEKIEVVHVKRLFAYAPTEFKVPDVLLHDVAQAVADHSKGVYEEAVRLLDKLRGDGARAFLKQYRPSVEEDM